MTGFRTHVSDERIAFLIITAMIVIGGIIIWAG